MYTRRQAREAKKANARPPPDNDCDSDRRVRPRLLVDDGNYDFVEVPVNHDHDYNLAPLESTPIVHQEVTAVPEVDSRSSNVDINSNTFDETKCDGNFSKSVVDTFLQTLENDINLINQPGENPIRSSTALVSPVIQSGLISSSITTKKDETKPSVFRTFSPGIPLKRDDKISLLEDDIDAKCNNAIEALEDIKKIWAKCDFKSISKNAKTIDTSWNQPNCSKNLNNTIKKSPSLVDEKNASALEGSASDDDLPPDVSKLISNSSSRTVKADATPKLDNAKRAWLLTRIKQLEKEVESAQKQCQRKFVKRSSLSKVIRFKNVQIAALKSQLAAIQSIPNTDSDDSLSDDEEFISDSKNGNFGDLMEAFSTTNAVTAQGIHNLQDTLSRCPDENEFADDPIGLTVPLMLHQKKALKWMIFRENEQCPGGILADDMGLGKTLTMIALIVHSIPIERRKFSRCEVDSADSDDDWDLPSKNSRKARATVYGKYTSDGGTLVVCPPTLLQQWKNEIRKRTKGGVLSVIVHHGNNRSRDPRELCRADVVITTYSLLHLDSLMFNKVYWKRVVLDEAHQIRNPKTNISEAACMLKSHKRWALTGTPVHNKPLDIYSILKFLGCHPWDDIRIWNSTMRGTRAGIVRLTALLKSLVMRRTKAELQATGEMPPLPPKVVHTIEIELDESETEVYKTLLAYSRTLFAQFLMQRDRRAGIHRYSLDQFVHSAMRNKESRRLTKDDNIPEELFEELNKALLNAKGDIQQYHILVLLLRLRQICDHPALVSKMIDEEEISQLGVDEDSPTPRNLLFSKNILSKKPCERYEDMSKNPMRSDNPVFQEEYESSKLKAIMEKLQEILPTGDKIIIVSQWTCMLEVIEGHLIQAGESRYAMFTGQVKVSDRQAIVDRFNNQKDDLKILLLSLTAGGQGLNLFGANYLIMVDNHWNPQLEKQAEDRIYRYGQTKDVTIYKFLCKDSIEQRVKELQDRKLQLASDILTGLRLTSTKLTLNDLKQLFQMR